MSKVFIEESSLTAIGDAVRAKTGSSDLLVVPDGMVSAISSIETGGNLYDYIPEENFVLSGNCSTLCKDDTYFKGWLLSNYPNSLSSSGITSANSLFYTRTALIDIPFTLDFTYDSNDYFSISYLFSGCNSLKYLPPVTFSKTITLVNSASGVFANCYVLREIPDDWTTFLVWLANHPMSFSSSIGNSLFAGCYSLRNIPESILLAFGERKSNSNNYHIYGRGFEDDTGLDEIIGLGCNNMTLTNNTFYLTFKNCSRVKNITFATDNSVPFVRSWKNQNIDMSVNVGYGNSNSYYLSYDTGFTVDTWIKNDTSYTELKDNPNAWTTELAYSRYNHDSAVATINSLPDTSAYLAGAGGTNTIKFKGESGSATNGGAINTLTEEEIAVATAKGWTVTLV